MALPARHRDRAGKIRFQAMQSWAAEQFNVNCSSVQGINSAAVLFALPSDEKSPLSKKT